VGGEGHRSGAKVGGTDPAQSAENFLVVPLHFFGSKKVQLVVLVSAFVMVSTVRSVSCLLFFYSRCPARAQPFVKVRARAPVPYRVGATVVYESINRSINQHKFIQRLLLKPWSEALNTNIEEK